MHNLKMLRFQNFCLLLIYFDIEFHRSWFYIGFYPMVVIFFQVHKIPVSFENFENVYKLFLTVFLGSIDGAIRISSLVKYQKSKNFPALFLRYAEGNFINPWVQN